MLLLIYLFVSYNYLFFIIINTSRSKKLINLALANDLLSFHAKKGMFFKYCFFFVYLIDTVFLFIEYNN